LCKASNHPTFITSPWAAVEFKGILWWILMMVGEWSNHGNCLCCLKRAIIKSFHYLASFNWWFVDILLRLQTASFHNLVVSLHKESSKKRGSLRTLGSNLMKTELRVKYTYLNAWRKLNLICSVPFLKEKQESKTNIARCNVGIYWSTLFT